MYLQEQDFYLNLENDVEDNEFSLYDQIGTLLENWTKYMWRNFRPFPSIWLNFTSYTVELCNIALTVAYSKIRQNFSKSVGNDSGMQQLLE